MKTGNHRIRVLLLLAILAAGCGGADDAAAPAARDADQTVHVAHFAWLSDQVARGGQPKGDAAFRDLAAQGVRTIISVDGARPDVEAAAAHGMRYVHIPIGYEGVPVERQRELAKTVRELSGPFFVHCHHGKHRGPAAAVMAQMVLGGMSNEEAVGELERAGTARKYTGLYGTALVFRSPADQVTGDLEFDFPEVAPVPEFAAAMAIVDRRFDNLKLVRKAGWGATEEHPDIDPAHESLQVFELLTESSRLDAGAGRPEPFGSLMGKSITASRDLEVALRAMPPDHAGAEEAFRRLSRSCSECHSSFRNTTDR